MPLFPTFPAYNDATNNIGGKVGNVAGGIGGFAFGGPVGSYLGGLLGRGIGAGVEDLGAAAGGWLSQLLNSGTLANIFSPSQVTGSPVSNAPPVLPTNSETNNPPMYAAAVPAAPPAVSLDTYSAPWDLATGVGAYQGGGGGNQGPYGASPGFRVA